jgi:hypothetical protein
VNKEITWEDYLNLVLKSSGIDMTMRELSEQMMYDSLKGIGENMNCAGVNIKNKVVIFDLDGCICDDEWRIGRIKIIEGQKLYDEYHEGISKDSHLSTGTEILHNAIGRDEFPIFITARPIKYRKQTTDWLNSQLGLVNPRDYWLFMRDNNDARPSVEVKKSAIGVFMSEYHNREIVAAFDDRPDVVSMYRSLGIKAYVLDKNGVHENNPASLPPRSPFPGISERIRRGEAPPLTTAAKLKEWQDMAPPQDAADILAKAAGTFKERNAVYRDNAVNVGKVMEALFPNGVNLKNAKDHQIYHLFELIIVKLTRFANTNLHHTDSIHDVMVYAAMIEPLCCEHGVNGTFIEKKEEKK